MKKETHSTIQKVTVFSFISLLSLNTFSANSDEIAKKLSNPVANLISVPFQLNYDEKIGPSQNIERYQLNIQPVIPIHINEDWNLISRTILPVTYQKYKDTNKSDDWGTGDIVQSLFFSPSKPSDNGITWGIGPAMLFPTASEKLLGVDQYGIGPTAVILKQDGGWTFGALTNHLWSIDHEKEQEKVNSTLLQPFISYTYPNSLTISAYSETTYDWNHRDAAVPLNISATKIIKLNGQLISVGGGAKYWIDDTISSPKEFGIRLVASFIFPK